MPRTDKTPCPRWRRRPVGAFVDSLAHARPWPRQRFVSLLHRNVWSASRTGRDGGGGSKCVCQRRARARAGPESKAAALSGGRRARRRIWPENGGNTRLGARNGHKPVGRRLTLDWAGCVPGRRSSVASRLDFLPPPSLPCYHQLEQRPICLPALSFKACVSWLR